MTSWLDAQSNSELKLAPTGWKSFLQNFSVYVNLMHFMSLKIIIFQTAVKYNTDRIDEVWAAYFLNIDEH